MPIILKTIILKNIFLTSMRNSFFSMVILCSLFFFACHGRGTDERDEGRPARVVFNPSGLEEYAPSKPGQVQPGDVPDKDKLHMYVLFNVSCPPCLFKLRDWDKYYSGLPSKMKEHIIVRPVCYSDDHFESFKYLVENNRFPMFNYTLYLDSAMSFVKSNARLMDKNGLIYALANSEDSILVYGSPLKNEETHKEYQDFITGNKKM